MEETRTEFSRFSYYYQNLVASTTILFLLFDIYAEMLYLPKYGQNWKGIANVSILIEMII